MTELNTEEKFFNENIIIASTRIVKAIILINKTKDPSHFLVGGYF